VFPVVEGLCGDAFLLAEGHHGEVGLGKAVQALKPELTQSGAGTNGAILRLGHGGTPGDRATPPKIFHLSST
jgi:hypothetical protein